jgi:CHRD domain
MRTLSATALLASAMLMVAVSAQAQPFEPTDVSQPLRGGHENPPVISEGLGRFFANVIETPDGVQEIEYHLRYNVVNGASDVQQAHIHIANPGNNGGIVAFLCSNLDAPADNDCPTSPGVVDGVLLPVDVLAVTEGDPAVTIIEAEDIDGLAKLMLDGATYANVHTLDHPGGEVRGQINPRRR